MARTSRPLATLLALAALLGLALLALRLVGVRGLPDGPEPIAWDRVACAHCRMLVSDPRFAAQLQTRSGQVLDFDDPGCLLLYVHENAPEIHAAYFHHVSEDRWLSRQQVAFTPGANTPMDYGLAARDRGGSGALSWEEATALLVTGNVEAEVD